MRRTAAVLLAALLPTVGVGAAPDADDRLARRARACTPCHGQQGRAAPDGYQPRIAGKPALYLLEQLRAFRDGRRRYALMTSLIEPLSDDYLRDLAGYFAAIDAPHPAPQPDTLTPAQRQHAESLVRDGDPSRQLPACAACHGQQLTGVEPARPSLLGLPRDYLVAQLGAWREGTRRAREPDCMAEVARRLTPAEVATLAAWLAARPVPASARPAAAEQGQPPLRCGEAPPG